MKKIYKNGLLIMAAGILSASCADYNETDNFTAAPDPNAVQPYAEYAHVKSYINRSLYPNMSISTSVSSSDFKAQGLIHAAAVTNFDNVSLGNSFMQSKFMKANGVKDFTDMQDILEHTTSIGYNIYGSPIAANSNQADEWINHLTAPIQTFVEYVKGDKTDYSTWAVGTKLGTDGIIEKKNGVNSVKIPLKKSVNIMEGFKVDPLAKYTFTFTALTEATGGTAQFNVYFCGKKIDGLGANGVWTFGTGGWRTVVIENIKCPADATEGVLTFENTRSGIIYVSDIEMGYYPDDHRSQTDEEINDTINYALNTWCDALMKYNAGRIRSFDLIEDAIHATTVIEGTDILDLKHSKDKYFWQDIFGSENYGPKVSKAATEAYQRYGGNVADLKFFIAESNLENEQKMNSLSYWINIWEGNGAKIDGINAKLGNFYYSEDADEFAANKAAFDKLMENLAATGKLIRLSNFDMKYQYKETDEEGNVKLKFMSADKLTDEQRQLVADYYAYAIKSYLTKIPAPQQAGICKSDMIDKSETIGLWVEKKLTSSDKNKDWIRTSVYKAFCDALSGK